MWFYALGIEYDQKVKGRSLEIGEQPAKVPEKKWSVSEVERQTRPDSRKPDKEVHSEREVVRVAAR